MIGRRWLAQLLALLLPPLVASRPRAAQQYDEVLTLTDGGTVEYEQREADSWRWFLFPTDNVGGVSCGLVLQRGDNDNFPRHGFVMIASSGVVPPGLISAVEYDPTIYTEHEDPVGPRFKYNWVSLTSPRPPTDWSVLTLGYNSNASATDPAATQVPLDNVLIGFRCNERDWIGEIPGCRFSLTARLVPYELEHGAHIIAPMTPDSVHVFRIALGTFDSLRLDITRDGVNQSLAQASGLLGAALVHRNMWSPPRPLHFPYNLSGTNGFRGDLSIDTRETAAMVQYQHTSLWYNKGLVNLEGCAEGNAGCRDKPQPAGLGDTAEQIEMARQDDLRDNPWAVVYPAPGRGYAALWHNESVSVLQRVCVGDGEEGVYYVTLWAAPDSGDGRLHVYDGTMATFTFKGDAIPGVDTTGWRDMGSATPAGCWCCANGACDQVCYGLCFGREMPPASTRTVRGYAMQVTALQFTGGEVTHGEARPGCVSYGQWRRYTIQTSTPLAALLALTIDADVEGVYVAEGRPPTATDYDGVARPPNRNLTISACDVTANNTWHVAVHLDSDAARSEADGLYETLYTLGVRADPAQAELGATIHAASCCDVTANWRVPMVPSTHGLRANVTLLRGAVHGVFVQYDSCPLYQHGDPTRQCEGLCEVAWATEWDTITSQRISHVSTAVTVPMGETVGRNDERRAGVWYVGVKALPGEAAEYMLHVDLAAPPARYVPPYCSHLSRFCASETQHHTPEKVITTAADAREPPLNVESAAPPPPPHALVLPFAAMCAVSLHGGIGLRFGFRQIAARNLVLLGAGIAGWWGLPSSDEWWAKCLQQVPPAGGSGSD